MDPRDGLMRLARGPGLRAEVEGPLGPFCHQFRNRLNSIKLGIYLAKRQATGGLQRDWEAIEREYLAVEDRLDRVQKVCRDADHLPVAIDLGLLFDDRSAPWADTLGGGGARLTLDPPAGCPTRVDVGRLAVGLDDLVRWRAGARSGDREVRVAWGRAGDRTTIRWSESSLASTPGPPQRGDPLATWTLPILARIMDDHGGTLTHSEDPGWEVTLSWPC